MRLPIINQNSNWLKYHKNVGLGGQTNLLTVEDYGNVSKLGKTRQRFLTEAASKSSCLILASNRKCYISVSHNFLVFCLISSCIYQNTRKKENLRRPYFPNWLFQQFLGLAIKKIQINYRTYLDFVISMPVFTSFSFYYFDIHGL